MYVHTKTKPTNQDDTHLRGVLSSVGVCFYSVFMMATGLLVTTRADKDADLLYEHNAVEMVNKGGNFSFRLTQEQRAKRTLLAKNVDRTILAMTPQQLQKAINTDKDAKKMKVKCISAYINHQYGFIKMQFRSLAETEKVKSTGLLIQGITMPPYALEKEIYIPVKQCMKCYEYDHYTSSCSATTRICSTCTSTEHRYTQCQMKDPRQFKCCMCGGKHKAVSGACKYRKQAIKEAKERINAQKTTPRASTSGSEGLRQGHTTAVVNEPRLPLQFLSTHYWILLQCAERDP